jgi:CHAT domain-containing protein/tetratricopeptide (TPR) repeat protein
MRRRTTFWMALLLVSGFFLGHTPANAGPAAQDDPVAQCAEAVWLFLDGRAAEAAPLLDAGLAGLDTAKHSPDLCMRAVLLKIRLEEGDRFRVGRALNNIGEAFRNLGRYSEALKAYEQALAIAQEVGDQKGEGIALNNTGLVFGNQGRYAEAQKTLQQALLIRREVEDRAGEGDTFNNIGIVYHYQGRYSEALEAYGQALAIAGEVEDRDKEGNALNNIGEVYRMQGRYGEALDALQQALAIAQAIKDRAGEGITRNNIGLVYYRQARYDEALEAYQEALEIAREEGNRATEGGTLNNIAGVYDRYQRYDEALAKYQEVLEITREVGDRAGEGTTLNNMGFNFYSQGRYVEALENYQQALAIRQEVGDRAGMGVTLNNVGLVYDRQGRYGEALEAYEQVLEIRREVGDRNGEGLTLDNVGSVHEKQGRDAEALAAYGEAMAVFEMLRSTAGSEAGRSSFIAQYADLYERAVELGHDQGQDAEAFRTSERGRSRAFLDSLATGSVELSDNAAANLLAAEQEAYTTRQAVQDALSKARSLNPPDAALVADLEAQLATAEQELQAAVDAITARGGQLAALAPGRSGVLDLPAVQALLDDQTTLVSYWVLGDQGALAFVITDDSFTTVELPDATSASLSSAVDNTLSWLNREQAHPKPLRDLYTWLVAPLAEHLQTPQVVIVPHQQLQYVPFAALSDGQSYFGQQHLLSVIPSASALPFIQQNAAASAAEANTHTLVFGNPTTGDRNLPPLANAASEAQAVASLLGTAAVTGVEASETRLRDEAAGSKVIHLAAHGGYNVTNPLYSAIYLAPGGAGAAGDGRLETHEVYGLDLKGNELVALSACQSNVGELSAGDELVGLTRAFFFAGTPTILSSLWSVDDQATEALMTAFYRHWQTGMGKAEALQAAQAEVRGNPQWASPFYWAGFVLNGDPGAAGPSQVPTPEASPTPTSVPSEGTGGGICGAVGTLVPLAVFGWWGVRRHAKVR